MGGWVGGWVGGWFPKLGFVCAKALFSRYLVNDGYVLEKARGLGFRRLGFRIDLLH